jgi:hypothetical protein
MPMSNERDDNSGGRAEPGTKDAPRRRTTAAQRLLDQAVQILGASSLAEALQVSDESVRSLAAREEPMTLAQQRVLALAILTVTEHPDLRRRAATLVAQVRAAEDYNAGVTARHSMPPPSLEGWR